VEALHVGAMDPSIASPLLFLGAPGLIGNKSFRRSLRLALRAGGQHTIGCLAARQFLFDNLLLMSGPLGWINPMLFSR
jgi:hypothetical protein